jgi:hypothetical protein
MYMSEKPEPRRRSLQLRQGKRSIGAPGLAQITVQQPEHRHTATFRELMAYERAIPNAWPGEGPAVDLQGELSALDTGPLPAPALAEEAEGGGGKIPCQAGQDIVVVVSGYRDGLDPVGGKPAEPRLQRAGRLVKAIVLIDDIAAERHQIHPFQQGAINDTLPAGYGGMAPAIQVGGDTRGAAADVQVSGGEDLQ